MGSGLRRRNLAKVAIALRGFFRGDLGCRLGRGLFLHDRVHLGFRRWWWCFRMSLNSRSHDLTVHELVAIDMRPDAVVIRPPRGGCRDRLHSQNRARGFLFLRRRISLQCRGQGKTDEKGQRQNGSYHIFVFGLRFRSERISGAKVTGQRPSESAETVRESGQKGNSSAKLFCLLAQPRRGLRKMFVSQDYADANNHAHQKTNHETKSSGVTHRALR